eukprot:773174-Rhodomonas_salina.1
MLVGTDALCVRFGTGSAYASRRWPVLIWLDVLYSLRVRFGADKARRGRSVLIPPGGRGARGGRRE